jgi:hypothetical protein
MAHRARRPGELIRSAAGGFVCGRDTVGRADPRCGAGLNVFLRVTWLLNRAFGQKRVQRMDVESQSQCCAQVPEEDRTLSALVCHAPAPKREHDLEFIWVILWTLWGILSGWAFGEPGDRTRILGPLVGCSLLGVIGGFLGEKYVGKRTGCDLITYWAAFWSVAWVMLHVIPLLALWALAGLVGKTVEGFAGTMIRKLTRLTCQTVEEPAGAMILAVLLGTGKGTLGGALGGALRLVMTRGIKQSCLGATPLDEPGNYHIADPSRKQRVIQDIRAEQLTAAERPRD